MNATIRVMPIVRNLTAIAAERALCHDWEKHPMTGIEVDADPWSKKYQEQLQALHTVLSEVSSPHPAELDEDQVSSRAPEDFADAHRRLSAVVAWLIEQGYSVLAYSAGGKGRPAVQIAYSEAAQRELRMTGACIRIDGEKTFDRFTALRNGVRIWWEREAY